jgi:hypothetical protein
LPHNSPGAAIGHCALVSPTLRQSAFTVDLSNMNPFYQYHRSNTQKHLHFSGAAPERQVCEAHQVTIGKLNYKRTDASSSSDSKSHNCSTATKHLQGLQKEPQRFIKRTWKTAHQFEQRGERRKAMKVLETGMEKPQVGRLPTSTKIALFLSSKNLWSACTTR